MNVNQMREAISHAYPGERWKARCACMRSNQVIAIYHSLANQGKLNRKPKKPAKEESKAGIQLTIFDMLKEETNGAAT